CSAARRWAPSTCFGSPSTFPLSLTSNAKAPPFLPAADVVEVVTVTSVLVDSMPRRYEFPCPGARTDGLRAPLIDPQSAGRNSKLVATGIGHRVSSQAWYRGPGGPGHYRPGSERPTRTTCSPRYCPPTAGGVSTRSKSG